jgi:hypothetical protein
MKTTTRNRFGKKSKISKNINFNKSKYKSQNKHNSLKTQKGGSAEMLASVQPLLDEFPSLKILIGKIFSGDNIKYFKLDGSMPDPFIKLEDRNPNFTPSFYLEWYKSKNPEFTTHAKIAQNFNTNIEFGIDGGGDSIYETVIAQICRDILIMLNTRKRNMNNNARNPLDFFNKKLNTINNFIDKYNTTPEIQVGILKKLYDEYKINLPIVKNAIELLQKPKPTEKNIVEINSAKKTLRLQTEKDLEINSSEINSRNSKLKNLLSNCENCIREGYKYRDVFELIMNYILWLGTRPSPSISFDPEKLDEYKTTLSESPFLIFPTYAQVSYNYVLSLMAAPIINFRLVNRKRKLHDSMGNSLKELEHDVMGHGDNTHRINLLKTKNNYEVWFANMSIIISTLYPYFNYKKLNIEEITKLGPQTYDYLNDEQKKQIIAIILFIFLHENLDNDIIYYLYFYSYLSEKDPKTIEASKSIKHADDWPKNIDTDSAILALKAIFDKHREQLNIPMKNLGDILDLQLPSERPLPLLQQQ